MGIYTTSKCPHCGYTLESMRRGRDEKIGHPFISCPECKHRIGTGKKYWSQLTAGEKTTYIFTELFFYPFEILFSALQIILLPTLIIIFFDIDLGFSEDTWFSLIGLTFVLMAILIPTSLFKKITLSPNKESSE